MGTLGEVIGLGIWEGILKTLKGKYFKSSAGNKSYFYFPTVNIKTPLEINYEEHFHINHHTEIGSIKLRVVLYEDKAFNPTMTNTSIPLKDLFFDYEAIH